MILLAFLHVGFPKYFNWAKELNRISLINMQMMQAHTFFIALFLILVGLLLITSPFEFLNHSFGKKIGLGLFIFWLLRLIFQFAHYSPKLWKGKQFETNMHIVFTLIWLFFCFVFATIAFFPL